MDVPRIMHQLHDYCPIFAGCGTTIEAARKNNRYAIRIDILPFALRLINR